MAYTYSVIVNGTLFNLEEIVDSRTLKIVKPFCSTKKTSGKGTMSVVIRGAADKVAYQNFMQAFLASQYAKTVNDCPITVSKDGTPVFIGYLDKSTIDIVSKKIPQDLTLSANDKSSLLDEKIRYNHIYATGGAGQSRNAVVSDLLSKLSTDSGITVSLVSTDLSDADICAPFAITEDKGESYRDVIDRILLEAIGYVLVFDPSVDGFRIKRIPTDIVGVTPREVSYLVNDSLRTKSAIYEKDGILLSFPNIVRRDNTNLYAENISLKIDDNGNIEGTKVQPGEYYPATADVAKVYQEFRIADRPYISGESRLQNKDLELLFATGVSVGLASNPNLILAPALPSVEWTGTVEYLPTKARAIYLNDSNKESNITDFTYTGTATYIDSYNKVTYPKACVKPEEYTAKTIIDADKAKRFACWLYNSKNYGETTSQWAEYDSSAYVGEIVNVIHKGTGVQMPHVIVQITDESVSGTRVRKSSIIAISIYSWSAYDEEDASLIETLSPSNPSGEAKLIKTLAQYYHSYSLETLIPNVFVVTSDTERQNGKTYYEENLGLSDRFVVSADNPFVGGKTYYEDASWLDRVIQNSGDGYFVNGHLVPTQDSTPQIGVTYYYYDSVSGEYVVFSGSTFDPNVAYFEYEEYPSYVWHRQKFIYSNGDVAYSSYAYYLTTADVANPFTITTLYGVSTGTEMIPTTDVSPIAGKEYYVITNGKYVKVRASGSFPVGTTVYEIPGFIGWSEGIPSAWRKGLYVWYKETTVYDNQPENTLEDSPKYSVRFTQEMEANCAFEGTLQDYTWNKNMRSVASEDVAVNIAMKIVGYGAEATPIVRGLPSAVRVTSDSSYITLTFDSNINATSLNFTIGLLYPTEDSTPQGGKTYYYYDSVNNVWAIFSGSTFAVGVTYYEDYPNVESLAFTINSVDITEKAMYLGLLSALPSSSTMYFLDGDHFVPTQNITVGAITYYKYMPYVYSGGSWVAVQDGQTYGKETSVQIMYDCAKDIYQNADYIYEDCESEDVAEAGKTYYNKVTHLPEVVAIGEDVSSYCTRYLNVPQEVISYYNYQEKLMAEHIVAEDIELARGGKIRSAGYVKGTAQKIMDEMAQGHTVENYQPGFYGDYEGNFEAYAAVLVDANIYYCNIVGELRNELFETVTSAVAGAEYVQNTLVDESWSADEGIKAAQDAGMSNDTFTAISCQLNNTSYNYGMIVPDPEKTVDVNNIDPDDTRTMPIKAQLSSVTGRIFVNNTEVTVGSTIAYGATIKNKERWLMDSLYNDSRITADKIVASNISWGGNSYPYIARITNPSATMISAWSQSATLSTGPRTAETVRIYIPDWFNGATCSCSMVAKCCTGIFSKEWYGDIDISKNGSSVIGGPVGSTYGRSATFTVNAGDYIDFYFGWVDQAYAARNGSYSISVSAQSCSALGFSSKGFYTFSYSTTNSKKRVSSISNRGTTGDHFQSDLSVSMSSPISWASANHCELASFSYTYGLYDTGFNFLNSSAEKQASLTSGMKPIATRFAFTNFNSNSWDSNNANNHYFHLNSIPLKTGSTPVQSAKIFSIDHGTGVTCSFSYQRKDEALKSGTDIKSVIWSAANVTIERDNGIEILQIGQNNWYKSFTIDFTALAKSRGNYAESIYPMKGEADRTVPINLGLADNRFDETHTKRLGNRFQGTEEGYINNLNLIPQTGISSFISGVTYYYFDNGILVPESSSTPVSGRQYFILGSAANYAYFDTLAMLDSMDNQKKRIDNLFVKLAQVEQSLSSSTSMIPSSKAVNDAIMNINDSKQSWNGGGPKVLSEYDDLIIRNFYSYGVTYTATGVTVNLDGPVAGGLYMRHGTEDVGGAIIVFGYLWDRPIFYRIANHRIMSEYYL